MAKGAFLALETGEEQTEDVAAMMKETGFADVSVHRDLAGNLRVVTGFMF